MTTTVENVEVKEVKATEVKKANASKKRSSAKKEVVKAAKEVASKKDVKTSLYNPMIYSEVGFANTKAHKKVRGGIRRHLTKVYDSIYFYTVEGKMKKRSIKEAVEFCNSKEGAKIKKAFIIHYKKTYITNDFTISSLYSGSNEDRMKEVSNLLQAITQSK